MDGPATVYEPARKSSEEGEGEAEFVRARDARVYG